MRSRMMRPASLLALAALLAAGRIGAAAADERRVAPFRVVFAEGAHTPQEAGAHGERNRRAVRHMARVFAGWGRHPGIRFVFVADRRGTCGGAACSAEHLLWQRVNATSVLLRTEAARRAVPFRFDRLTQAFLDELRRPMRLPQVPSGTSAIDLRTLVDAAAPAGECPWHVLVFDPDLPPALEEADGKPVIPVAAGASVAVSAGTVLRVAGWARRTGPDLAVWENGRGEFAAVPPSVRSGDGTALPTAPVHLHLLAVPAGDAALRRFGTELTPEFRRLRAPPPLQPPRMVRGRSRDMGDDVQLLPPGGLQPPRLAAATYCRFTFAPASASRDGRR